MTVIPKYIVVRNGKEKMTFATKKEADEYDKMLDIADNIFEFLEKSKINFNENQLEDISLLFAQNRAEVTAMLKGIKARPNKKTKKKNPPQKTDSGTENSRETKS